jgi:hypothetical protein
LLPLANPKQSISSIQKNYQIHAWLSKAKSIEHQRLQANHSFRQSHPLHPISQLDPNSFFLLALQVQTGELRNLTEATTLIRQLVPTYHQTGLRVSKLDTEILTLRLFMLTTFAASSRLPAVIHYLNNSEPPRLGK